MPSRAMELGARLSTSFNVRTRVRRVDVVVVALELSPGRVDVQARVLASDGEVYGPISRDRLRPATFKDSHALEAAWVAWAGRRRARRTLERALVRWVRARAERLAEALAQGVLELEVEEEDEDPAHSTGECCVCLTDPTEHVVLACGKRVCNRCVEFFAESVLMQKPPTTPGLPCPCGCSAGMAWILFASAVSEETMTRVVSVYGATRDEPTRVAADPHVASRKRLEEA